LVVTQLGGTVDWTPGKSTSLAHWSTDTVALPLAPVQLSEYCVVCVNGHVTAVFLPPSTWLIGIE